MKKHRFLALLALGMFTAMPALAEVNIDIKALEKGQLPAAGTLEEAKVCTSAFATAATANGVPQDAALALMNKGTKWEAQVDKIAKLPMSGYMLGHDMYDNNFAFDALNPKIKKATQGACEARLSTLTP
jgi:hypothetical protein